MSKMKSKKIKIISLIVALIALVLTAVSIKLIPEIFAENGTFSLSEIMATSPTGSASRTAANTSNYESITSRSVDNLLGYIVTEGNDRNVVNQSEYVFCVGQHNVAQNSRWYLTKVLDITEKNNAVYNDVNGNRNVSLSGDVYSKLAIYAYIQNVYKVENYGTLRTGQAAYANSLDYLLPQVANNYFSEVSAINPSAYTGVSKELMTLEDNYANFVNNLNNTNGELFSTDKTTEIQNTTNGTTYGPINIKLKSGLSSQNVTVHETYTGNYVGDFSTGVRVTLNVQYTDGTSEDITSSSSTYIKDKNGNKIDVDSFDWLSNFYIETSSSKSIEKITVKYEYDLYKARYIYLDTLLPDGTEASQAQGIFGGAKETKSGSFEITVDRGINVSLQKIDSNDSNKKLSGVVLQVLSGNSVIAELTTGTDGKTDYVTLVEGTYTVKEIRNSNYGYKHASYSKQFTVTSKQVSEGKNITIDVENTQELRDLTLTKEGANSTKQEGVPFIVTIEGSSKKYIRIIDSNGKKVSNISSAEISTDGKATSSKYGIQYVEYASDATIFVTDSNGLVTIKNLEVYSSSTTKYKYTAIEQSNSNYAFKGKTNAGKSASTSDLGSVNTIKVVNTPEVGELKIEKVDQRDNTVKLAGVDFKLSNEEGSIALIDASGNTVSKITGSATISKTNKTYTEGNVTYYTVKYVSENEATTFTTDEDGNLVIKNLEVYKDIQNNKYNYVIKEIATNNDYYEITEKTVNATLVKDGTVEKTITNKQKYIDLSGYVWEDKELSGKVTGQYNELYKEPDEHNSDQNDLRVGGVIVRLKYTSTNAIVTNADGESCETTTDSNGEYKFTKVSVEDLSNYYVEFEYSGDTYNGLNYTTVAVNAEKDNGSKAKEVATKRTEFNNLYKEITPTFSNTNLMMIATTKEAGFTITQNATEITNINMGLVKREQADLSINTYTDIENVQVSVNDAEYTYEYGLKDNDIDSNVDVTVESKYEKGSYTRTLDEADVKYSNEIMNDADTSNDDNRLKVYVTYKIYVQNNAQTLSGKVTELANYLDDDYTVIDSWIENDDNTRKATITWNETSKFGNTYSDANYKAIYTTSLANMELSSRTDGNNVIVVYLKVQVSDDVVLGLLNGDATLENISEINAYTTYYTDDTVEAGETGTRAGQVYGTVDINSQPGNVVISDESQDEDDTKRAPSLILTVKEARGISGTVWKDEKDENKSGEHERLGNGILDSDEKKIQNVKVELIDVATGEVAKLYTKDGEASDAIAYTDENGNYEFIGVVPDNYYTRFTYGAITKEDGTVVNSTISDGTVINVRNYKSTIVTSETVKNAINGDGNLNWYLDVDGDSNRYSDAVDDLDERAGIEVAIYGNIAENYTMYADTAEFKVRVEFTSTESTKVDKDGNPLTGQFIQIQGNMDFGIIERPLVDILVEKEISYIKVSLQDGEILIEGDPRTQNISYVKTGLDGLVPAEIDTELLQGATLNITYTIRVTNNSETDYDYTKDGGAYYKFGNITDKAEKVNTTVTKLVDYLDNNVVVSVGEGTENPDWTQITDLSTLRDEANLGEAYISEEVYNKLSEDGGKYIILETSAFGEVESGSSKEVTLKVSKLLSESDEIVVNNYIEILELGGDVARTVSDSIPGNYVPTTEPVEKDEDTVKLTITPPTGSQESYDMAIIVTSLVAGLAIIIVGIVLIKKFVIAKK